MAGACRIGTSGWVYPHWRGSFYPENLPQRLWLDYYTARFDTVELNNSFYRLPSAAAFEVWRKRAPEGFTFAVKASRFLTHMKKLKDPEGPLRLFFDRAGLLGGSLGPVLYQLPPRWRVNLPRFERFVAALPRSRQHAIEFREPGWVIDEVLRLMERCGVALCIHDLGSGPVPCRVTAPFVYVRFHGGPGHGGRYGKRELEGWARTITQWQAGGLDVHAYFNNDVGGHAVANALELRSFIGAAGPDAVL